MKNTAQSWFLGGPSSGGVDQGKSPSLLADWNAYAAAQDSDSSALGFDLEAAVRNTSDKVSGTFNVFSKGVRDLPGSFKSATSNVPSGKSLMYFSLLLAAGVFFIFIAFTMFLPVIVLRLPFTLGFVGSMVGTIYVSMWLHSYVLSVLFSVLQVISLSYYAVSYFPGGSSGLKFLSASLASSVLRCFRRCDSPLLLQADNDYCKAPKESGSSVMDSANRSYFHHKSFVITV
ncbi:Vesicle transport protein, Got1/SFT2-like protein [Corchorus olitorius]|uniref:Vesicle transport protein n=1 Tax=Corchorus olitorius TaxID=93759 RepID=A0A1R3J476_9ROSI|nr:Vesicle transport protein, Got1/SFT2-like protein [Corchorus olitorius]